MSPANPNGSLPSTHLSQAGVQQIARRCTAAFGHITRLTDNVPACLALHCQIDAILAVLPVKTGNVVLAAQATDD